MIVRGCFNGAKNPVFFRNLEIFFRVSVRNRLVPESGTGRSKSFRFSPIPEVDLEQLWNQRHHTCSYVRSFSERNILGKDKPNEK